MLNIIVFLVLFLEVLGVDQLDSYNVDRDAISVSGLSAGACFATQFHVAFSTKIMGVGVLAGMPYYCARNLLMYALSCMNNANSYDVDELVATTVEWASPERQDIDPVQGMAKDKIYVFHGTSDSTVVPGNSPNVVEYYEHFIEHTNIRSILGMDAGHGFPTLDRGVLCRQSASPYINRCDYEAAEDMMEYIYSDEKFNFVGSRKESKPKLNGQLIEFDQTEFTGISLPGMGSWDSTGWVYIPSGCVDKQTACKLHVVFHGCQQGQQVIETEFVTEAGYLEVGEANNIIMFFPQIIRNLVNNPNGCFDWWGYSGVDYAVKEGAQMEAVALMVDRLVGDYQSVTTTTTAPTPEPCAAGKPPRGFMYN